MIDQAYTVVTAQLRWLRLDPAARIVAMLLALSLPLLMAATLLPAAARAQTPVLTLPSGTTPATLILPDGTTEAPITCTTTDVQAAGWSPALASSSWIGSTSNCATRVAGGSYVYTVTFSAPGTPANETLSGSLMVDDTLSMTA
jgi:hypothetical protein